MAVGSGARTGDLRSQELGLWLCLCLGKCPGASVRNSKVSVPGSPAALAWRPPVGAGVCGGDTSARGQGGDLGDFASGQCGCPRRDPAGKGQCGRHDPFHGSRLM